MRQHEIDSIKSELTAQLKYRVRDFDLIVRFKRDTFSVSGQYETWDMLYVVCAAWSNPMWGGQPLMAFASHVCENPDLEKFPVTDKVIADLAKKLVEQLRAYSTLNPSSILC